MCKAVLFFDLFFTLIEPKYSSGLNENDILGVSVDQWESIAEDQELYVRRATGQVQNHLQMIDEIVIKGGFNPSPDQRNRLLELRMNRMRSALHHVDSAILNTLSLLKEMGLQLCVISNADTIDIAGWEASPLCMLFDSAIFSCDIGSMKPQPHIYQAAMERMGISPQRSFFIGDGGSDELHGAKAVGMKTVLSDHFIKRTDQGLKKLLEHSDYHIIDFRELLEIPLCE